MESNEPAPVSDVTARREGTETTEAIRLKLLSLLSEKRCPFCGQTGHWKVYSTKGRIRYIRCKGCQMPDQVAL